MSNNTFHDRLGLNTARRVASHRRCAPSRRARRGLSLLEVILALALLGVASAIMAQAMQMAATNAIAAQRQAEAELAAESVMNQIIAGVIPMQPTTTWTPVGTSASSANWNYMLQTVPSEVQNMLGIEVSVRNAAELDATRPADLTVIRWIVDPALGLDTPPSTGSEGDATGQAAGAAGAGQTGAAAGGLNGRF
jgi:prepilin-type N-terminal cleavage/methylation domain-containing protein